MNNSKTSFIKFQLVICLVVMSLLWDCKSNKTASSEADQMTTLNTLLEQQHYYIEIDEVLPFNTAATNQVLNSLMLQSTGNTAGRIHVRGDGNFMEIKKDSIKGYLPFFGERRLNAGNYGGRDLAIQFEGELEDFSKQLNNKKGKLELEFKTEQKDGGSEQYDVRIEIFPNKTARIAITPTYRTFIEYSGTLREQDVLE